MFLSQTCQTLYKTNWKVSASKSLQGHDQGSLFQGNTRPWDTGDTKPEGGNSGQPIWCRSSPTQLSHSLQKEKFPTPVTSQLESSSPFPHPETKGNKGSSLSLPHQLPSPPVPINKCEAFFPFSNLSYSKYILLH